MTSDRDTRQPPVDSQALGDGERLEAIYRDRTGPVPAHLRQELAREVFARTTRKEVARRAAWPAWATAAAGGALAALGFVLLRPEEPAVPADALALATTDLDLLEHLELAEELELLELLEGLEAMDDG